MEEKQVDYKNSLSKYMRLLRGNLQATGFYVGTNFDVKVIRKNPSLEDLQKRVGGNIELVIYREDPNFDILVNEEGAINNLPENVLFWVITGLKIHGNVVVLKKGVLR
jgi:hypothetical protein